MGKFSLLFSVAIEHTFFPDHCCRHLALGPSDEGHKWIANLGLVTKQSANTIFFFYDHNRKDALFMAADDPREGLHFFIKGYSGDPHFMNYTDSAATDREAVLYFGNRHTARPVAGTVILHKGSYVTGQDQKKMSAPEIAPHLNRQDRLKKPTFLLDIAIDRSPGSVLGRPPTVNPRCYVVRFKNRETYWKYILLNDLARDNLYIEDVKQRVKFDEPRAATLPGRRSAFTIRSRSPLPLVEDPQEHFQLKSRQTGNEKILVKRLPVASSGRLCKEKIDERDAAVSEIFINV